MERKKHFKRRSRSVPLAKDTIKAYMQEADKRPSESLRQAMKRGKIDRTRFIPVMEANRIPDKYWPSFLPAGGVDGVAYPNANVRAETFIWFPNEHHIAAGYSPLTWAGSGENDFIVRIPSPDPWGREPSAALPLEIPASVPVLRIGFRHRVTGVNPEHSWWSAVIGSSPGTVAPEWATVDLTRFDSIKIFARGYADLAGTTKLIVPIRFNLRFEDDNVDVPGRPLHRSSSWSRKPIIVTDWSRPTTLSLRKDFNWGPNAFWPASAAIDRRQVLQITFGMDGDVPDCEGCIEVERIELQRDAGNSQDDASK